MKKILFLTGNGLGDSVMLTPSFAKYAKENPDTEIHIATLKRFGQASVDLFNNLDYGYNIHPILSDPWEIRFDQGLKRIVLEGETFAKTIEADIQLCHSPHGDTDWRMHKIYRFAKYMGISLIGNEFKPKLHTDIVSHLDAHNICNSKNIVVHITPGNSAKNLSKEMFKFVKNYCNKKHEDGYKIIEIGSTWLDNSIKIKTNNMKLTKSLVDAAEEVVAIDSVVMHLAGAFNKKLISLWTVTPVHQALPFWLPIEDLVVYYENEHKTLGSQWKEHRKKALEVLDC